MRVKIDTNAARKAVVDRLLVARRAGYILLLDSSGRETARLRHPGNGKWAELVTLLNETRRAMPDGRSREILIKHLAQHDEPGVRGDMYLLQAKTAKTGDDKVALLLNALRVPAVRTRAIDALAALGPAAVPALPRLLGRMQNPLASDRAHIAIAVARIDPGGKRVVPAYRDAVNLLGAKGLEPAERTLVLAIVRGLACIAPRSEPARELLRSLSESADPRVARTAAALHKRVRVTKR